MKQKLSNVNEKPVTKQSWQGFMTWAKKFAAHINYDIERAPQRIKAMVADRALKMRMTKFLKELEVTCTKKTKKVIQVYADEKE